MIPRIFILTWCRDITAIYGSLLTFKTFRVGFPSSDVFVFDNASIPEARPVIKAAAESVGARFIQMTQEVKHHDWLRWVLFQNHGGKPIAFCDPDVIFWDSIKSVSSDALLTGRLIPAFYDRYSDTQTQPRLHTSLLWIPDPAKLTRCIADIEHARWEADLLKPVMTCFSGKWLRWDTGASLYAAMPHVCRPFTDAENDRFEHIFCGSHVNWVLEKTGNLQLKAVHEQSVADYTQLKGLWRRQDAFFKSMGVQTDVQA
jgi:hypothetical protein